MGDAMYFSVLVFLVLTVEKNAMAFKAGLVGFMETLPFLILSPLAGALVDGFPRRSILMWSDALCGGFLLLFVVFVSPERVNAFSIAVLAVLLSTCSTVFGPARDALIPLLFSSAGERVRANAFLQTLSQAAWLAGSSFSAVALSALNRILPHWSEPERMFLLLVLDGLSFWASFACIAGIGRIAKDVPAPAHSFIREAVTGYRWIFKVPPLVFIFILTAADNFFIMGPAQVGGNLFVKNTLAGNSAMYSYFLSALFAGWFAGGIVMIIMGPRLSPLPWLLFGIFMDGITYIPFYWIREFPLALGAIAIHGFFIPFITVTRTTYLQHITPEAHRGKVLSLVAMTVTGFTALSALATGVAGEFLTPPALYLIAGSGGATCALLGWCMLRRWLQMAAPNTGSPL